MSAFLTVSFHISVDIGFNDTPSIEDFIILSVLMMKNLFFHVSSLSFWGALPNTNVHEEQMDVKINEWIKKWKTVQILIYRHERKKELVS